MSEKKPYPLAPSFVFKYGKHPGKKLQDVIEEDPGYIKWMLEQGKIALNELAQYYYEKKLGLGKHKKFNSPKSRGRR